MGPVNNLASVEMVGRRSDALVFDLTHVLQVARDDIRAYAQSPEVRAFSATNDKAYDALQNATRRLLEKRPVYQSIRYIDEYGYEKINIISDGNGTIRALPQSALRDVSNTYYFKGAQALSAGQIYASNLDMGVDFTQLLTSATGTTPQNVTPTVPTLRFIAPVFNNAGDRKGFVAVNIFAEYFLREVRRFEREGEFAILLDHTGKYIAHPHRDKERYVRQDVTFFDDYHEMQPYEDEILHKKSGYIITPTYVVYFYRIDTTQWQKDNYGVLVVLSRRQDVGTDYTVPWWAYVVGIGLIGSVIFWLFKVR